MDFFYTTEYQRSFLNNLKSEQRGKPKLYRYRDSADDRTERNSIGIQANLNNNTNRKVHFELDQKQAKKYEAKASYTEPLTPRRTSAKESLLREKPEKHISVERKEREIESDVNTGEKDLNGSSIHRYSSLPVRYAEIPYSLDLRAGNESENYHRAPFIQKKKRVDNHSTSNSSIYRVSSEPSLQKKRITLYPRNHNILLTSTIREEETPRIDGHPLKYVSSYNLAYKDTPYRHDSPIMSVEYTMNRKNTSDSVRSVIHEFDDSNRYYKRDYDKGTYETEYQQYFTKRSNKESPLISAARDNKEFLDYYKEILKNRVIAYSPSLSELQQSSSEQKSPRNEKHQLDEKENEKSSSRPQSFVNGRYTRRYEPEIYSP